VRRLLVLGAVVASALAASVGPADATSECRGLQTCVPVAGPWVVVSVSRAVPRPQTQYRLSCPKGFVVGGIDAELTDPGIDLWFLGAAGSPVAPGRTTSRTIVFVASYVGAATRPPTFRPHIGCVPATGGGGRRTPTAVRAVVPPGRPTVLRVRTLRVTSDRALAVGCRAAERLVGGYATKAFRTAQPPSAALVASLSLRSAFARDHVTARASGGSGLGVVQVAAACAGGR
jgi:hypothetical protein